MTYTIKKIYPSLGRFWMRQTDDNPYFDKEQYFRELEEEAAGYRDERWDDIEDICLDDHFGLDMSDVVDEWFDLEDFI